ncbi:hypothetical protein Tco_0215128 [Tanacetum coccineum]
MGREKRHYLMESLYGLKQAPKACYDELSTFPDVQGFTKAVRDAVMPDGLDTAKSTTGGYIVPFGDKLVLCQRNKTALQCLQQTKYVALSASFAQVMWIEDTTSMIWLQIQQNNRCTATLSRHTIHQMASAENNPAGPVPQSLVLHQMTSNHNRSKLGIQNHSNEPSSSKLIPKVVPLAVKTATSRQELELVFHHHISMLRTTGINPMIQPEPEDLPKDNPKLEIAVLRLKSRRKHKGNEFTTKGTKEKDKDHIELEDKSNLILLMKSVIIELLREIVSSNSDVNGWV